MILLRTAVEAVGQLPVGAAVIVAQTAMVSLYAAVALAILG